MARYNRGVEKQYPVTSMNVPADAPPYYRSTQNLGSRLNPKNWSRRTIALAIIGAVVLLIIIVVGAVEGVKANRYPDYFSINYKLQDTCGDSSKLHHTRY